MKKVPVTRITNPIRQDERVYVMSIMEKTYSGDFRIYERKIFSTPKIGRVVGRRLIAEGIKSNGLGGFVTLEKIEAYLVAFPDDHKRLYYVAPDAIIPETLVITKGKS